jgi:hypothetical protein
MLRWSRQARLAAEGDVVGMGFVDCSGGHAFDLEASKGDPGSPLGG